VHLKANWELA